MHFPLFYLLGHGVELQHFRRNDYCTGIRELKPVDSNPAYDFNYQQTTFLAREITVLPVNIERRLGGRRGWERREEACGKGG